MITHSLLSRAVPAVGLTLAIAGALALAPASAFAAEGGEPADGWEVVDTQINGDGFEKVLINGGIPFGPTRIDAWCPSEFPYLDGTQGTPDRPVGKGLIVDAEVGVSVVQDASAQRYDIDYHNYTYTYTGTTLVAWNHWAFADRGVSVKMMCTKSKAKAWTEPWNH